MPIDYLGKYDAWKREQEAQSAQDFLRRKAEKNKVKQIEQEIKNAQLIAELLELFQNDAAKKHFLELCKKYRESCWQRRNATLQQVQDSEGEKDKIHNKIMETVQHLSLLPNAPIPIFDKLDDRDKVAQAILDYLDYQEKTKSRQAA